MSHAVAMASAAKPAGQARLTTLALFSRTPNPSFSARPIKRRLPPISISMDPALVDPGHLQALMLACAHSCATRLAPPGTAPAHPDPVDLRKLRTALAHSFIVVSVFCSASFLVDAGDGHRFQGLGLLGLGRQGDRRLVGFGRAVSDVGLTASVHDVVVHPSLQRRGIGRKILERITRLISCPKFKFHLCCLDNFCRVLHSRGIYDISALCTEKERPFFEACGFGDDAMGSTTMMYTRNMHK